MSLQAPTTEQIRDGWNDIAAGFDEVVTPASMRLGEEALQRIDLRPGTRLLDVAAGSGALSIPAARAGADVLAVDLAPTMIDRLMERARTEGLTNLEGRVMDGQALDLDDGLFDVTASVNGVSLFPDLQAGLREMVRVTRPGGRVLVVAFGPPDRAEFVGFFLGALRATAPGSVPPPAPLPFQVADPAVLRRRLEAAGLDEVRVETHTWHLHLRSAEHLWDLATHSHPLGAELSAGLTDEQAAEAKRVLGGMLRERSGGGPGGVLTAAVNLGTGTR